MAVVSAPARQSADAIDNEAHQDGQHAELEDRIRNQMPLAADFEQNRQDQHDDKAISQSAQAPTLPGNVETRFNVQRWVRHEAIINLWALRRSTRRL